jgi:hypothetical protein
MCDYLGLLLEKVKCKNVDVVELDKSRINKEWLGFE